MRKPLIVSALMLAAFVATAAITVVSDAKPACDRCRKDGCPQGFCYVDCVSCCYNDFRVGLVCFK